MENLQMSEITDTYLDIYSKLMHILNAYKNKKSNAVHSSQLYILILKGSII